MSYVHRSGIKLMFGRPKGSRQVTGQVQLEGETVCVDLLHVWAPDTEQTLHTAVPNRIQYGEWIIASVHFPNARGFNSGDRTQTIRQRECVEMKRNGVVAWERDVLADSVCGPLSVAFMRILFFLFPSKASIRKETKLIYSTVFHFGERLQWPCFCLISATKKNQFSSDLFHYSSTFSIFRSTASSVAFGTSPTKSANGKWISLSHLFFFVDAFNLFKTSIYAYAHRVPASLVVVVGNLRNCCVCECECFCLRCACRWIIFIRATKHFCVWFMLESHDGNGDDGGGKRYNGWYSLLLLLLCSLAELLSCFFLNYIDVVISAMWIVCFIVYLYLTGKLVIRLKHIRITYRSSVFSSHFLAASENVHTKRVEFDFVQQASVCMLLYVYYTIRCGGLQLVE